MYRFPKDLYCDIRIEKVIVNELDVINYEWKQNKTKIETGAMIRIFDGNRWYYNATTELDRLQEELDQLAAMATPNPRILEHPTVACMEVNHEVNLRYKDKDITKIPNQKKIELVESYLPLFRAVEEIQMSKLLYKDSYIWKHIITSKGTDVTFDQQFGCIGVRYKIMINELPYYGGESEYKTEFETLADLHQGFTEFIQKDLEFAKNAVTIPSGKYTCILSPNVVGIFAHESFGHKSEADFMVGDETMKREWAIGTKVGSSILNIIDTGCLEGSGYVPFDDEGTRAKENYLIKDGYLSGRLHSASTAGELLELATGNARAMSFEYEPIVRMTSTYIGSGTMTKEELFHGVKEGIYIDDCRHGSGMSTFTLAPSRAYMIRNGEIAEPVKISVLTGNVMSTLKEIDGISEQITLRANAFGGCGKMEQFPLNVGFGGPYVRVNNMNVQ